LEFPNNYRLISLRGANNESLTNIAKDLYDKLEKKFDKIVQGKDFAKLHKEQQKDCLSSFVNHIQEAIKQLK
jgi:hypothetical protein